MKRDLLKVCVLLSVIMFSAQIYASEDDCDCYMEYEVETEEKVSDFTETQKKAIQEATSLLADN